MFPADNPDDLVCAVLRRDRRRPLRKRRSAQRHAAEHPSRKPARWACQHRQEPGMGPQKIINYTVRRTYILHIYLIDLITF